MEVEKEGGHKFNQVLEERVKWYACVEQTGSINEGVPVTSVPVESFFSH